MNISQSLLHRATERYTQFAEDHDSIGYLPGYCTRCDRAAPNLVVYTAHDEPCRSCGAPAVASVESILIAGGLGTQQEVTA